MKYYWCDEADLDGIPVVISRTGWTAVVGYEIYLRDPSRGDDLWERILDAGKPYNIRVTPSSDIRRIEAGIFDWGSDIGLQDNPFEITGLERLVEEQEADYVGKEALERIRREGVSRKLVGIELEGGPVDQPTQHWPVAHGGETVGHVTDACWSPRLEKNIGYVWVPIGLAAPGTRLDVETDDGTRTGRRASTTDADRDDRVAPVHRPAEEGARLVAAESRSTAAFSRSRRAPRGRSEWRRPTAGSPYARSIRAPLGRPVQPRLSSRRSAVPGPDPSSQRLGSCGLSASSSIWTASRASRSASSDPRHVRRGPSPAPICPTTCDERSSSAATSLRDLSVVRRLRRTSFVHAVARPVSSPSSSNARIASSSSSRHASVDMLWGSSVRLHLGAARCARAAPAIGRRLRPTAAPLRRTPRASPRISPTSSSAHAQVVQGHALVRRHPARRSTTARRRRFAAAGKSPRAGRLGGRPSRDGQPLDARSRPTARPRERAASGTRRPARGGSRRSPLAR